ncbi:MAG TPA: GMC family oxidoreductase [Candidatus Limnocylindrales bacterium]
MATEPADVLIIGAGASGGVVARRLAEAGFRVVCLEQGLWHDRAEYRGAELDWELTARKQWSGSPNIRALPEDYPVDDGDADVSPLMFAGVGGSMLLFAAAWPRMLPSDFRVLTLDGLADDWPLTYDELRPFYERSDRQMGVSGVGGDPAYPFGEDPPLPPLPIGPGALKVARAHTRMGWHWWPEPNAILSVPREGRHPCVQRGTCMQGCPEGAKASTDLTHWPHALARGARLVTGARVRRLETNAAGLVTGALWLDRTGVEHFERARVVVLAANAIGTARLLLLSTSPAHPDGLANSSGLVGRRLMMHPFASVTGLFDESLESWQGHFGCSIESFEFYETDERRGFVRGAKWGLAPTGGPINAALPSRAGEQVWGADHHLHVRARLGRGASWGLFGEDLPDASNSVTLSAATTDSSGIPAPKLHYRVSDNSRRLLDFHIARASESLLEAGAHTVEVDRLMRYSGWHLLGTARMGDHAATSVVDRWNQAHDVPNLYVVDGSCFVTSGGVNPTSTICALALRAADHMVETRFDQQVPL